MAKFLSTAGLEHFWAGIKPLLTFYGTCSTAATTAAKTVAVNSGMGFTLVRGVRVVVKFSVTNTALNPTLNVNSTGAKSIYYRGAAISAGYLAANRTYEFIYDGTQYSLVGDIDTDTNDTTAVRVSSSIDTQTWLRGAAGGSNVVIDSTASASKFVTFVKYNSTNGKFLVSGHMATFRVDYLTNSTISGGTNEPDKSWIFSESGKTTLPGDAEVAGSLSLTKSSNALLTLTNTTGNTNAACITFANSGGRLGMVGMSGSTGDGSLLRWAINSDDTIGSYYTILDSSNYNNYAPTKTGGGASGTWSITATKAIQRTFRTFAAGASSGTAGWRYLGTVGTDNIADNIVIDIYDGSGYNGSANQNAWVKIILKKAYQSTASATSSCGVTVYRYRCPNLLVSIRATAHNRWKIYVNFPWQYANGSYTIEGYNYYDTANVGNAQSPSGTEQDIMYLDFRNIQYGTAAPASGFVGTPCNGDIYIQISS